ncbi:hypothetical protein LDENG_00252460, partial [Lucifuga dentata]
RLWVPTASSLGGGKGGYLPLCSFLHSTLPSDLEPSSDRPPSCCRPLLHCSELMAFKSSHVPGGTEGVAFYKRFTSS